MRRFITSLPGRLLCQLMIIALILPSISLAIVGRAFAQTAANPVWAVVEFTDRKGVGTNYGKAAASAFAAELSRTNRYEVPSQEAIARSAQTLGVDLPARDLTTLFRIAQDQQASTVITGDIVDYKVVSDANGKQGLVSMRVVVYDVASQIPVNGAAVSAKSTIRPAGADDATLINDAIAQGSASAFRDIQSRSLPSATVLNTTTTTALVNQGSRSGFSAGQEVLVLRGREQVASGRIVDLEPDQATIKIDRSTKGVQPGDKIRAIYPVPTVIPGFSAAGDAKIAKKGKGVNTSTVITALIVVGILALLLGGGNAGGRQDASSDVQAEPFFDIEPGVQVRWAGTGFGTQSRQLDSWQIYRDDIGDAPVVVQRDGNARTAIDRTQGRSITYANPARVIPGDNGCGGQNATTKSVAGLVPGRPYTYAVEAILVRSIYDVTTGSTGSTAGSTGGVTGGTTGGTTGNTTGLNATGSTSGGTATTNTTGTTGTTGTSTTGGTTGTTTLCYLRSDRTSANGTATALYPPRPQSPAQNATLNGNQDFVFTPGANGTTVRLEYILQVSTSSGFEQSKTVNVATSTDGSSRFRAVNINNLFTNYAGEFIYWRVGVRNPDDNPGPRLDPSGVRYIFGRGPEFFRAYRRASAPPPPPG